MGKGLVTKRAKARLKIKQKTKYFDWAAMPRGEGGAQKKLRGKKDAEHKPTGQGGYVPAEDQMARSKGKKPTAQKECRIQRVPTEEQPGRRKSLRHAKGGKRKDVPYGQ